ncbi:MAG: hypothetical protein JWN56_398 [Sphingobacteriales bacterium]|nr:hypothetical protein [Sphingobacteriales bacterium]
MKNLILALILIVPLAACKKDKKSSVKAPETIIRATWFTTSEKHVYYNGSNTVLFQESKPIGDKYVLLNDDIIKKSSPSGVQEFRSPFTLSKTDNKLLITFDNNDGSQTYEVVSANEQTMTWVQVTTNQPYDNGTKTAAKKIVTIDFHCPCP